MWCHSRADEVCLGITHRDARGVVREASDSGLTDNRLPQFKPYGIMGMDDKSSQEIKMRNQDGIQSRLRQLQAEVQHSQIEAVNTTN